MRKHIKPLGEAKSKIICGLSQDGCFQVFENTHLYYTESIGVREIDGPIFDRWFEMGTEWGKLGYPKSNERELPDGATVQEFEHGYIYYTESTKAWDISGGILSVWQQQYTAENPLGYPTSSEQKTEDGITYQSFEHGNIYWTAQTGAWIEHI